MFRDYDQPHEPSRCNNNNNFQFGWQRANEEKVFSPSYRSARMLTNASARALIIVS